jgi:hypothetical protein
MLCGSAGRLELAARTHGGSVAMYWYCADCDSDWPVTHEEQLEERRSGPADRRRLTRTDRRNHTE